MAMIIHMSVEGVAQGNISEGCSTRTGRENTTHVMRMESEVFMPFNIEDGRAQGHRIFKPVKVVKPIDKSSPKLATALVTNELMTITMQFYRPNPDGDGKEEQFYTIVLEEANLVSHRAELPFTLDPETAKFPPLEYLEFAFVKITHTYNRDGIEFTDSWKTPIS